MMQPQHQAALGEDPSESAGRSQYPISCHLRKPVLKAALRQVGLATLSGRCSLQQQMFAARQAWTSRTVKFDCGVGGAGKAFNHRVERRHSIRNSEMIIDALQFRHARPPEPMALRDGPESPDKQPLAQIKFRQSRVIVVCATGRFILHLNFELASCRLFSRAMLATVPE